MTRYSDRYYKGIGIVAPIRDFSRQVIATLGIALTAGQIRNGLEGYVDLVKKTCDKISSELGYLKI